MTQPHHIPHFRRSRSPDARRPNYKLLAIGINYTSSPDGSGPGDPELELKGPVNDAKAMGETMKEIYNYRKQDIFVMTDEEGNKGTEMWPSAENILRAIDNLVRGASPGDVFVFYYAGHCDRQESMNNDVEDEHTYIIACDSNHILDNTLREHLVDPLPRGSRLTAITDACYSGPFLALNHYRCHYFLRRPRCQSLSVRCGNPKKALRRHTEAAGHLFIAHAAFLRRKFCSVVTTTLVIIRLKSLAKRSKSEKCEKESRPPTPTPILVHCNLCNRDHDLSDAPDVISLSPCAKDQRTWEDSTRKGKGMTDKLIRIMKKDPSIKLGDLNQRLNKCLSKLSFKRVKKATAAFRHLGALVTPGRREELKKKFQDQGIFDFNEQTAQFGSLRPLRLDDRFILERDWTEEQPDPD